MRVKAAMSFHPSLRKLTENKVARSLVMNCLYWLNCQRVVKDLTKKRVARSLILRENLLSLQKRGIKELLEDFERLEEKKSNRESSDESSFTKETERGKSGESVANTNRISGCWQAMWQVVILFLFTVLVNLYAAPVEYFIFRYEAERKGGKRSDKEKSIQESNFKRKAALLEDKAESSDKLLDFPNRFDGEKSGQKSLLANLSDKKPLYKQKRSDSLEIVKMTDEKSDSSPEKPGRANAFDFSFFECGVRYDIEKSIQESGDDVNFFECGVRYDIEKSIQESSDDVSFFEGGERSDEESDSSLEMTGRDINGLFSAGDRLPNMRENQLLRWLDVSELIGIPQQVDLLAINNYNFSRENIDFTNGCFKQMMNVFYDLFYSIDVYIAYYNFKVSTTNLISEKDIYSVVDVSADLIDLSFRFSEIRGYPTAFIKYMSHSIIAFIKADMDYAAFSTAKGFSILSKYVAVNTAISLSTAFFPSIESNSFNKFLFLSTIYITKLFYLHEGNIMENYLHPEYSNDLQEGDRLVIDYCSVDVDVDYSYCDLSDTLDYSLKPLMKNDSALHLEYSNDLQEGDRVVIDYCSIDVDLDYSYCDLSDTLDYSLKPLIEHDSDFYLS